MNPETWDAIVVGGGIAGGSAAIHLAERGHRVLLLERRRYPVQKLCGEFLSVEAQGYLARLGVAGDIEASGSRAITELRMVATSGAELSASLPGRALGISRAALDSRLLAAARAVGADCRENTPVERIEGSLAQGFRVVYSGGAANARAVFGAYGKRAALDGSLGRDRQTSPFVAFKRHYFGPHARDTIEVFGFQGGYVGISPVEDGLANACFIVHRSALQRADGKADDLIDASQKQNSALARRLAALSPADKLIGCSNISFRVKGCFERDVCMIGDTAGMIAPLCGDGMSMAMRSAEIAADCADRFLKGNCSATRFKTDYADCWRREFLARLTIGRALQSISGYPPAAGGMIRLCNLLPRLKDGLIRATRGQAQTAPSVMPAACHPTDNSAGKGFSCSP